MDVPEVGKHVVGRCHILVNIVEVGEQQLAPAIEMVKGFIDARTLCKALMEFADQFDRVGHLPMAMTAEQVADGDIGRTPKGTPCLTGQILIEEESCPFVGENDSDTRQVCTIFVEEV